MSRTTIQGIYAEARKTAESLVNGKVLLIKVENTDFAMGGNGLGAAVTCIGMALCREF